MAEILLVRHAQSYANKRDFAAFGNTNSPLTDRGEGQARGLNQIFRDRYGIHPEEYERPVAVSEFTRTQQTAELAGFNKQNVIPLINESDVDREVMTGIDVIAKHCSEGWVPEEVSVRTGEFIDRVQSGDLDYQIYFTHGLFIASVLLDCTTRLIQVDIPFDEEKRGYIPLQTAVVQLEL